MSTYVARVVTAYVYGKSPEIRNLNFIIYFKMENSRIGVIRVTRKITGLIML